MNETWDNSNNLLEFEDRYAFFTTSVDKEELIELFYIHESSRRDCNMDLSDVPHTLMGDNAHADNHTVRFRMPLRVVPVFLDRVQASRLARRDGPTADR